MGIEMKQEFGLEGLPKKQYQVVEINGIKFDYFDFDLAKQAVSGEILNIQEILRQNPTLSGAKKVNGLLHTLEEKLTYVLEKDGFNKLFSLISPFNALSLSKINR